MIPQLEQSRLSEQPQPLLSPRAIRNINRRRSEGAKPAPYRTETEEFLEIFDEVERNKTVIRENMGLITENMVNTMSRAFLANPHMNPEMIVSAVFAGADENTIYQMGAKVAQFQADSGVFSDDHMTELEAMYPWVADYKNDLRNNRQGQSFRPADPRTGEPTFTGTSQPTQEWFQAATTGRWDQMLRTTPVQLEDGTVGFQFQSDPKSLGGTQKISRDELRRRDAKPWWVHAIPQPIGGFFRDPAGAAQTVAATIDLVDTGLVPVRFMLDRSTPEFISDPASAGMRATTRYGFGAIQGTVDLLENIVMSATANPELAPKSFPALIRERGVVDGIGAGLREAALSTGFGQATFRGQQTGSGFFIDDEAQREADKLKMLTVGTYLDDNGDYLRTRSLGTMTAEFLVHHNVTSQDDYVYNLVSGGIDAAFELLGDFTNYIPFVGWGDDAVKGLRALKGRAASKVADHLESSRWYDDMAREADSRGAQRWAANYRAQSDEQARLALEAVGINTSRLNRADVRARLAGMDEQQLAIRSLLLDEAGVIREGDRRTVILPEFAKFLTRGRGRRLVKEVQEETSANRLQQLFRGNLGTVTAVKLAKATTAEDVVAIMVRAISDPSQELKETMRMAPHVGIFSLQDKGLHIRRAVSPYTRMGTLLPPGAIINPLEADDAMQTLRQLLALIPTETGIFKLKRYDVKKRDEILDGFMEAFASGDMGQVKTAFGGLADVLTDIFIDLGFDVLTSKALVRYVKDQTRAGEFRWTEFASDAPIDTTPLMFNDLMSSSIEIIDGRHLQQIIRGAGRMSQTLRKLYDSSENMRELRRLSDEWKTLRAAGRDDEAEKLIPKIEKKQREIMDKTVDDPTAMMDRGFLQSLKFFTDQTNDIWKTYTIARFAYVLRVVPEEAGRVWLSGVFEDWVDWFAASMATFERVATAGKGRYLSDAAGRRFTRKTREIQKMEVKHELLIEEMTELGFSWSVHYRPDPVLRAQRKADIEQELAELSRRYQLENEAWDANKQSYAEAQIGDDRTRATRAVTRRRVRQQVAIEATGKANRNNANQHPFWIQGVTERIIKMASDVGGAQDIARAHLGMDVAAKVRFEFNGVMGTVKEHLATGHRLDEVLAHHYVFGGGAPAYEKHLQALRASGVRRDPRDVDAAREWVNEVINEMEYIVGKPDRIALLMGVPTTPFSVADEGLMRAIATGRFDGFPLQKTDNAQLGSMQAAHNINPGLRNHIGKKLNDPSAPTMVNYTIRKFGSAGRGERVNSALEKFTNTLFGAAYGISSDVLARSPGFRRLYWKQMAEYVRTAAPDQAEIILKNARKAKLDKKLMKKVETNARMSVGNTTWDELDQIVRISALDHTKNLLFDATRRGATSDAMRIMVAFGDAWYEVLKTWTKVNMQRGGMPIKSLMKGIEGGQDFSMFGEHVPFTTWEYDPETDEYEEKTSRKRKGFMYNDPSTDQLYFGLPMSGQIARLASRLALGQDPGAVGELRAPVEGLNIFGTLSPGLGPYGNLAVQPILSNVPSNDWLWSILAPFGRQPDPQTQAAADEGLGAITPQWLRRTIGVVGSSIPPVRPLANLIYNFERSPSFMNLQLNIAKSLDTTGNYSWDAEGRLQLINDTRKAAVVQMGLLALGHFIGPAAPQMRHLLNTVDPETGEITGNIVQHQYAAEQSGRRQTYIEIGEDPNQALIDMIHFYGPQTELASVPNTNNLYPGQEQSREWWDWYRSPGVKRFVQAYPMVGAFFGAVNAERDNDVALQMRAAGLTSPKTLEELIEDGNRTRGFRRYNTWLQNNGLDGPEATRTPEQQAAAAEWRREIERSLNVVLDSSESRNNRRLQLNQLSEMVRIYNSTDPKDAAAREYVVPQMETDFGKRVRIYMITRDTMQQLGMNVVGLPNEDSWLQSWQTAPLRDRMRELGNELSNQDEGFSRLYQFVLEREMLSEEREPPQRIRLGVQGAVR